MRFVRLTLAQHESDIQDCRITIGTDSIVSFRPFKYISGKTVTMIQLTTNHIEVTEDYEVVQKLVEDRA